MEEHVCNTGCSHFMHPLAWKETPSRVHPTWQEILATAPPRRSRESIMARINALKARRFKMLEYLDLKREELDFHGVQDAASDLRDIDAEILGLEWVTGEGDQS